MATKSTDQSRNQSIRLHRTMMGLGSYACTMVLVLACYFADLVPGWVTSIYIAMVVVTNITFLMLIKTNINLTFKRPDMTMEQVITSVLPGLFTMYFIDSPMARSGFLLLALVPLVFGTLGLKTIRALIAGLTMFGAYVALLVVIFATAPHRVDPLGDAITAGAFFGAVLQVALIGGYIGGLRRTLGERNRELNQALDTIESLANKDELTGVWNRRYLLRALEKEACVNNGELTVIMMDIDHFKAINDTFGHPVGDRVLTQVAKIIQSRIRHTDHFGRFGGEEFLLIMPGADLVSSQNRAEHIRCEIETFDFAPLGYPERVTLSFGLACRFPDENYETTIKRADEVLYLAKADGRNCVRTSSSLAGNMSRA